MSQGEHQVEASMASWCDSLLKLYNGSKKCENILTNMENSLSSYKDSVSDLSDKMKQLDNETLSIHKKLEEKKKTHDVLHGFLTKFVVTPQLTQQINDGPGTPYFESAFEDLQSKLEACEHPDMCKRPAVAASIPELEKLRDKAIASVKDFLLDKINALKKPKANIQLVQKNSMTPNKSLFKLLRDWTPQTYTQVRTAYVSTVSQLYLSQFQAYIQSLQSLRMGDVPKIDILTGTVIQTTVNTSNISTGNSNMQHASVQAAAAIQAATGGMSAIASSLFGAVSKTTKATPAAHPNSSTSSGGVHASSSRPGGAVRTVASPFSLDGRSNALTDVGASPVIPLIETDVCLSEETIVRSIFRVLIDSASAEVLILATCFAHNSAAINQIFNEVLNPTIQFIIHHFEKESANSFDLIGQVLSTRTIEAFADLIVERQLFMLAAPYAQLRAIFHARAVSLMDFHVSAVSKTASPSAVSAILPSASLPLPVQLAPLTATRRIAELLASLHQILKCCGPSSISNQFIEFQAFNSAGSKSGDTSASLRQSQSPKAHVENSTVDEALESRLSALTLSFSNLLEVASEIFPSSANSNKNITINNNISPEKTGVNNLTENVKKKKEQLTFLLNNLDAFLTVQRSVAKLSPIAFPDGDLENLVSIFDVLSTNVKIMNLPTKSQNSMSSDVVSSVVPDHLKTADELFSVTSQQWIDLQSASICQPLINALKHFETSSTSVSNHAPNNANIANPTSFTAAEIEMIDLTARTFEADWRSSIEQLRIDATTTFSHFDLGMQLLQKVCGKIVILHTKFVRLIKSLASSSPTGIPISVRNFVTTPTIYAELQKLAQL